MSDELILYTNPMSRGRIARWMLEEVGAPYTTDVVFYGDGMKSAGYRAINPMGKVPALRHRGTTITETAAICAYLADAFPQAGLAPPLDRRGAYYRWLFFAAGPLESGITMRSFGLNLDDKQQRTAGCGSYADLMDTLEKAVSNGPYIAGDAFSAADVYVGSHIGWGLQFGTVEPRPAFNDYWDRLKVRPAHRRAEDIDNALMPAEQ
ncbi:MAG: glutathione S-transferase family protein [Hyphomicrobiaceae bacterium]|nr:glutathione S-transferase family protein [Hyphomicrobiaceae bacterium]